jgi:uncharacterized membrane-anchored protein YhcB (DUF1043 family)
MTVLSYFLAFIAGVIIGALVLDRLHKRVNKSIKEDEELQKQYNQLNRKFLNS